MPRSPLFALKLVVFSLGIVLVGGFIFVVGAVVKGLGGSSAAVPEKCRELTLSSPLPGATAQVEKLEKGWLIHWSQGGQQQVQWFDNCGKLQQSVKLD